MNKSHYTNGIALLIVICGYLLHNQPLQTVGMFALSGALTNWLAVHMLFEKVPGLYGSGVIPARFEEFKAGIRDLMMLQFFTAENIDRFLSDPSGKPAHFDFEPVLEKVDLSPAFNALVIVVQESSFGNMLAMVGGVSALEPLKEPFIEKMKESILDITCSEDFDQILQDQLESPDLMAEMQEKIKDIIEKRLDELTPQQVKEIIQEMIKQHLGWLVVWGGVFGGLIGLIAGLFFV